MKWGRIFWREGGFFVANLAHGAISFYQGGGICGGGGEAILWHRQQQLKLQSTIIDIDRFSASDLPSLFCTELREIPVYLLISLGLLLVPPDCISNLRCFWCSRQCAQNAVGHCHSTYQCYQFSQFFVLNHTTDYNVCLFHCLAGNSHIMRSTFRPFSTRKNLINALSSEVSHWRVYADDVNYDLVHFRLLCKKYLTSFKKVVACCFLL